MGSLRKSKDENPSVADGTDPAIQGNSKGKQKTKSARNEDAAVTSRRMPKRAAACVDFKEKALRLSDKDSVVESRRDIIVEDELAAISLTSGHDVSRPNRRLTDFIFHDENGKPQSVEMMEVTDLFITGLILPVDPASDKSKEKGVRCEGFGRIEQWSISGYEDGFPVIWVSTDIADYDCFRPAASYRKIYGLLHGKAHACIEVYKQLSPTSGGDPDIGLEDLVARVVRSMSDSKTLPEGLSIKDFIFSQGEFIYNQLIGLDDTSKKCEQRFVEMPVLQSLFDESKQTSAFGPSDVVQVNKSMNASLKIWDGEVQNGSTPEENEDTKLAKLLQEQENWRSLNQVKNKRGLASSNKFYIKINEDEIANDYPLPVFYKPSSEETDEYLIFESNMDISSADQLPRSMLHNWSLYNSDSRLVSLELLPMKPCADIDVTIFGSGIMTGDDGGGFCLDGDSEQGSSASTGMTAVDGIPVYLSAIKEWMIEFGANMIFISIRTDMAWYRLGRPSKQYAPWYTTVIKTARLGINIITLLKEQTRVARMSFADIIKRISAFDKNHPAYISSNSAAIERYVVVHGQIILQQFAEYPDKAIQTCAFLSGLKEKMIGKHHTKWLVKKKSIIEKGANLNPRASMGPVVSKRKLMPATTTRLINRIWGEYYSNYSPENLKEGATDGQKEDIEAEAEAEVEEDDDDLDEHVEEKAEQKEKYSSVTKQKLLHCSSGDAKWDGKPSGKMPGNEPLYQKAYVHGEMVVVGGSVLVEDLDSQEPPMYFVEHMFEKIDGSKMVHGRLLVRGSETILGNAANEREVFLTDDCLEFELGAVRQIVVVKFRLLPWGYQHRKANADADRFDRERAEDREKKGLLVEYYCRSLYSPERGAFLRLPDETMGTGSGCCYSCKMKKYLEEKEMFKLHPKSGCSYEGVDYHLDDFVYVAPHHVVGEEREKSTFKSGRNVGLKAFVVCQLLEIESINASKRADPESVKVKLRRFYRPEDISKERAYRSDMREVYYSEQILTLNLACIEGKCEVRRNNGLLALEIPYIYEHTFFCEHLYEPDNGAIKQLPSHVKFSSVKSKERGKRKGVIDDLAHIKNKGKGKEGENEDSVTPNDAVSKYQLATLDIFAGCGGLSEGLQRSGVSVTKWAIEYEEPAGEAFSLNHPEALVFVNNCNVILRAIMLACGSESDCISTPEADDLAKKLDEKVINSLPRPGQVDFINGGPPCQGFSGMNRFNQGAWSKVQCEMILAFLSFAEYFRPRYFLLENVRNFISFNKGQTFRLTVASLLEMGYQVRYGILEAGAFGVSQSRKRAFIWAAAPDEILPEWPEPMHVFAGSELKISLDGNCQFAAVRSTAKGAAFRPTTVRDTIGDLPAVENGASKASMEYTSEPVSWYQKMIRGDVVSLVDHVAKEMNELNLIRCQKIPKRPGCDWRDLPDEKVRLSTGQMVDLIPWCLPNTAKRHNQWKGLFGRLDWEGNFPTSITDPQPMGKVGMCFHPDQDRIVTVRECARSQGFPDRYKFAGNIHSRHRQIGNAVPPPLAFALGRKLKEAVETKMTDPTALRDCPYLTV